MRQLKKLDHNATDAGNNQDMFILTSFEKKKKEIRLKFSNRRVTEL